MASISFNNTPPAYIVSPVLSFYQYLRDNFANEIVRLIIIKKDYIIHAGKRGQYKGSVFFCIDGAVFSLITFDRTITIDTHTQDITLTSSEGQVCYMPSMKNIKTATCEYKPAPFCYQLIPDAANLFRRHNFLFRAHNIFTNSSSVPTCIPSSFSRRFD